MIVFFCIGFILFNNLIQLDFIGLLQVLYCLFGVEVYFVVCDFEFVVIDCGFFIMLLIMLDDCLQLDFVCVFGGFGIDDVMWDR